MPLALAIKNNSGLVVASDTTDAEAIPSARYNQLMLLPNRCAVMVVGNREAIRHAVADVALPKVTADISAAGLAQLIQAALVLEVIPNLQQITGRVEVIVAGIDPVRHTQEPGLYYMDSAQDFYLTLATGDTLVAGSTAVAVPILNGQEFAHQTLSQLIAVVKDCFAGTKLRWPSSVGSHVILGQITPAICKFEVL